MSLASSQVTIDAVSPRPMVWHVGGDDTHMRIPLLLALRERGFEVGAVGSGRGDEFSHHGIGYWRYMLDRWISPWADWRSCTQLRKLLLAHKPDIVHAYDTKPVIYVPLVAKAVGIAGCVSTVTGLGYLFSSNSLLARALRPLYLSLQRWASSATEIVIFQNPDDQQYFVSQRLMRPGRDVLVLGSGIDTESLTRERVDPAALSQLKQELKLDGRLVVTMVARLVEQKGVREYLAAARAIREGGNNAVFLLAGPLVAEGRQAIPVEEIERSADVVRYLGPRRDVPAILALTDIFVLPSYYREGIPRVLLEAGAMELPLITCAMPGCRDVVRHGWNGLLVPPRDVTALADAILKLLASADVRSLMGCRSRAYVKEQFDLQCVADAYAAIYHRLLGTSSARSQPED